MYALCTADAFKKVVSGGGLAGRERGLGLGRGGTREGGYLT